MATFSRFQQEIFTFGRGLRPKAVENGLGI